MAKKWAFSIPYPPSVNKYWVRRRGGGLMLSPVARAYKKNVAALLHRHKSKKPSESKLKIEIYAVMPDRRKRDLDNICKGVLDAMEGIIYVDDCQFDSILIERIGYVKGGRLDIEITEIEGIEIVGNKQKIN